MKLRLIPYVFVTPLLAIVILIMGASYTSPRRTAASPSTPLYTTKLRTDVVVTGYAAACDLLPDPQEAGRIYLNARIYGCTANNDGPVYESTDGGYTWRESSRVFPIMVHETPRYQIEGIRFVRDEEAVYFHNERIWQTPRQEFVRFFHTFGSYPYRDHFDSAYASLHDPQHNTTIITMGELGVLVGPYPPNSGERAWTHIDSGIGSAMPFAITVTNPMLVSAITLLALLVPPLPLLHAWLLAQVWRYCYAEFEEEHAWQHGWRVTIAITGVAAVAIVGWLMVPLYDFTALVGGMTLFTAAVSAGYGWWLAQHREMSPRMVRQLTIASLLVALIVPLGVATTRIGFGWFILLTILVGFICCRRMVAERLEQAKIATTRWLYDRLALEFNLFFILALVASMLFGWMLFGQTAPAFAILGMPLVAWFVLMMYTAERGAVLQGRGKGKKAAPAPDADVLPAPDGLPVKSKADGTRHLFAGGDWSFTLSSTMFLGTLTALVVGITVFIVQAMTAGWFVSILR
jgi:hypothetical protein